MTNDEGMTKRQYIFVIFCRVGGIRRTASRYESD
jgi:hypothetical protein